MTHRPWLTRRAFLRYAAFGSAGVWLGCGRRALEGIAPDEALGEDAEPPPDAPEDHPEETPESDAFPLGISSGDVAATSAVLSARYAGRRPLFLRVWQMQGESYRRVAEAAARIDDGGFVSASIERLVPSGRYRFAFFEQDGERLALRSPIGRFRTAMPPDSTGVVTFGATACTKQGKPLAPLARAAERRDLDAFLLLGDSSYNDGSRTLDEYRAKWAESLSRPEYRALRQSTGVVASWDDHEVDNGWNPETFDPVRLEAAKRAMREALPMRTGERMWRSIRYGRTVELFVLDTRSERRASGRAEYLSREQMDWLKRGLEESPAVFKLVMSSVPIGDFPFSTFTDGWANYPDARVEILGHVAERNVRGVVWLSGDFHLASVGRVTRAHLGSDALEVLAGPGGQNGNPLAGLLTRPQFDWATAENNFAVLRFDGARRELRVAHVDGHGRMLFDGTYAP